MNDHATHPVIQLKNAGVCYAMRGSKKNFWALKDVSLTLNSGETLGVIGRNGAGKSTLLKILTGILKPDRGDFVNYGYSASMLSLQVGFAPYLTGRQNIFLSGMLLGLTRGEVAERLDSIIDFSGLGEFIDQPIRFYSSGMKSRLGFSVAAALDPEILILDEVLSVGDRAFQQKSRLRLESMMQRSRVIVIVSHSVAFLQELCTHALWLEKGRMRGFGEAKAVLDAYVAASGGPGNDGAEGADG